MGTLTQAKQILAKLPGVKVQAPDSALKGIRPRRDYDNDFVLTGLKLPKPEGGTVVLPADVLSVFAQARRAVHPEYLQILVNHAGRVWAFDRGMLIDVTDDTQKGKTQAPASTRQTAMQHNPTCAFGHKKNPAQQMFKNPVAQELYDLANYGCSCGTQRKNPVTPAPAKIKADSVERFVVVDEDGDAVEQVGVVEGRRAGNLALFTMRNNHPREHFELVELPKEMINPTQAARSCARMTESEARLYVRKIKNVAKRAYAEALYQCVFRGQPMPKDPKDLSYMGAQAVRIQMGSPE